MMIMTLFDYSRSISSSIHVIVFSRLQFRIFVFLNFPAEICIPSCMNQYVPRFQTYYNLTDIIYNFNCFRQKEHNKEKFFDVIYKIDGTISTMEDRRYDGSISLFSNITNGDTYLSY